MSDLFRYWTYALDTSLDSPLWWEDFKAWAGINPEFPGYGDFTARTAVVEGVRVAFGTWFYFELCKLRYLQQLAAERGLKISNSGL